MASSPLTFSRNPAIRTLAARHQHRRRPSSTIHLQRLTPRVSPEGREGSACDKEAERQRRILELLPLVRQVALKIHRNLPPQVELDDLIGAGTLGLLDAARKFDATRKVKIGSYARHRIRGAILDGLRALDSASRDLRKKNKKLEESLRALEMKLCRPAEDEERAQALGMNLPAWHGLVQELQASGLDWMHPLRVMFPRPAGEGSLVATNQESQFDACYSRERRDIANQALACLSERERRVIFMYHVQEKTMKEISAQLRVDESRVSQLHSAAVERLRLTVKAITERPRPFPVPSTLTSAGAVN